MHRKEALNHRTNACSLYPAHDDGSGFSLMLSPQVRFYKHDGPRTTCSTFVWNLMSHQQLHVVCIHFKAHLNSSYCMVTVVYRGHQRSTQKPNLITFNRLIISRSHRMRCVILCLWALSGSHYVNFSEHVWSKEWKARSIKAIYSKNNNCSGFQHTVRSAIL